MAGRPREFDRDEALGRARDAFWRRGYEGTSMADLVEALGIASARIYAAFGSKDALFREAVGLYQAGRAASPTVPWPRRAASAWRSSACCTKPSCSTHARRAAGMHVVVAAATNCTPENEAVAHWLAERRRTRAAAIADRLRRAAVEGEVRPGTDAWRLSPMPSPSSCTACPCRRATACLEGAPARRAARRAGAAALGARPQGRIATTSDRPDAPRRRSHARDDEGSGDPSARRPGGAEDRAATGAAAAAGPGADPGSRRSGSTAPSCSRARGTRPMSGFHASSASRRSARCRPRPAASSALATSSPP